MSSPKRSARHMALVALAMAALAAPASAATFRIQAGGGGGGGACNVFDVTSSAPLMAAINCPGGPSGSANGIAAAGFGFVGVESGAFAIGPAPMNIFSSASYADTITFSSVDPAVLSVRVAAFFQLDGLLENQGASQPRLEGGGNFGAATFDFLLERTATANTFYRGLILIAGTLNDPNTGLTSAILMTQSIDVPVNTPIDFKLSLNAPTFAVGPGNFGTVAFANTFEVPIGSDAFLLPDGVTANSGTWLVNNRRVDPNAAAIPEPATWALMIGGFGMAGGMLRRRRAVAA